MSEPLPVRRGRPRDPLIDQRVLEATRNLLATSGLSGTTIQAVARTAGVRPNAIYRRWPSRVHLIEEAVFPGLDALAFVPSGDLARDLTRFAGAYRGVLARPEVRAAVPHLLRNVGMGAPRAAEERGWKSARPLLHTILRAAGDEAVDRTIAPDDIFDLLVGAILYREQLSTLGLRGAAEDRTVELVCRAVRPMRGLDPG